MSASVTIILPVFNGERYLDEAISSVRSQTLDSWRLLVLDDGSTDRTPEIAAQHAAEDVRITLMRQANAGPSATRNAGLAAATTRWVALLDHDDVYLPTKLERQMRFLEEHPDLGCLATWGYRIGSRGRTLGTFDVGPTTPAHFARMRSDGRLIYLLAASVVFDREVALDVGGFRADAVAEDLDLWNRIADAHAIETLPDRLVRYRVHGASLSASRLHLARLDAERLERNNLLRRAGQPEVSLEEYLIEWEQQPAAVKRASRRVSQSLALYRHGGGLLADRNPLGLWYMLRSASMQPMPIMRRAIGHLGLRRTTRGV